MLLQITETATSIDITTIVTTMVGTIGAGGLFKLVQLYYKNKKDKRKELGSDGLAFRESLQDRVIELEDKVDYLQARIEEMIKMYADKILTLSTEKATLIAENKAYKNEIEELKCEVKDLINKI